MSMRAFVRLLLVVGLACLPIWSDAKAQEFTGEMFLQWERGNQDTFIQVSVTMVGIVASQGRNDIAECIDTWYGGPDVERRMRRHNFIMKTIRENPEFHPQATILAILQKQCGSFKSTPP